LWASIGLEESGCYEIPDRKEFLIDGKLMYIPLSAAQEVAIWYNGNPLYKYPKTGDAQAHAMPAAAFT